MDFEVAEFKGFVDTYQTFGTGVYDWFVGCIRLAIHNNASCIGWLCVSFKPVPTVFIPSQHAEELAVRSMTLCTRVVSGFCTQTSPRRVVWALHSGRVCVCSNKSTV